jgi:hypothetical protein
LAGEREAASSKGGCSGFDEVRIQKRNSQTSQPHGKSSRLVTNNITIALGLRMQECRAGGESENGEQVILFRIFNLSPSSDSLQQVLFKIKGVFLLGIFL